MTLKGHIKVNIYSMSGTMFFITRVAGDDRFAAVRLSVCLSVCLSPKYLKNRLVNQPNFFGGHRHNNISKPIDFGKILIQDGRNMDAILKNLKIALSSLILVRFASFFRQNAQNVKGKKSRTSNF